MAHGQVAGDRVQGEARGGPLVRGKGGVPGPLAHRHQPPVRCMVLLFSTKSEAAASVRGGKARLLAISVYREPYSLHIVRRSPS